MTSNPPRRIRVSGRKVVIKVESPELQTELKGTYSSFTDTIAVLGTMSSDQQRMVVVHELTHCIEQTVHVEMTEQDVTGFANILYAVIRDNPKLMAWLQER